VEKNENLGEIEKEREIKTAVECAKVCYANAVKAIPDADFVSSMANLISRCKSKNIEELKSMAIRLVSFLF